MNNETNKKTCYYCSNEVQESEGVQWGSYFYCDSCFKRLKCQVDSYHSPAIPLKFKSVNGEENNQLFFGIELETTKDVCDRFTQSNHTNTLYYIRKNFKTLDLNFETDASIGDGVEIITQPMSIGYIKAHKEDFKNILTYLSDNGYYSHNKGKCGLHIHVSRLALGSTSTQIQETIEKIMLFVETYRNNIEILSRRCHNQFSRYNSYTIPYHKENTFGSNTMFKNDDFYKSGKLLYELNQRDNIGHSSVVNVNTGNSTTNGKTIEFRMFRGTLKYETFMATIEFVYNLVNVCRDNMVSKISWNKVINYSGEYLKDYVDSLNILEDNLYLRDNTKYIEDAIEKQENKDKEIITNYKNSLNDITTALSTLLNGSIDFSQDTKTIKRILQFRYTLFNAIINALDFDTTQNLDTTSLYDRMSILCDNSRDNCVNGLKKIKETLSLYTRRYGVNDDEFNSLCSQTIELINNKLKNMERGEEE